MLDFTVLIPVYNTNPAHLLEAVNSVINQSIDRHYGIYIVDDGSDNLETLKMLDYLKSRGCKVFHLTHNMGTSAALNEGHKLIQSEWIAIMGSDDISHRDRFKLQIEHLEKNLDIDVLGTNLFSYYDDDIRRVAKFTSNHDYQPDLKKTDWLTNHGTVFYRNQKVKDAGLYNEGLRRAQDIDLWKRMYLAGNKICNLKDVLYAWRRFR
jgi:glycosyltransferase involved in cell wall biosynthesis